MIWFYQLLILCFGLTFFGCANKKKQSLSVNSNTFQKSIITIISPTAGTTLKGTEPIKFSVTLADSAIKIDSLKLIINNHILINSLLPDFTINPSQLNVGKQNVIINAHLNNQNTVSAQTNFILLSDIIPAEIRYTIKNTYPHDKNAYTQGLIFEDGVLFESTGLYGQSSLRMVEIKTGKVLRSKILEKNIFAEGITIYNNKIIQITYKEFVGFIYHKSDFKLLAKFSTSTREGWGLVKIENEIAMTDGGHILYFLDTNSFNITHTIEVYDNNGPVDRLNELEMIGNDLFANIYGEDYIVRINPINGKVTGKMNCSNLLSPDDINNNIDVLNGIAYDPVNKRIFITGKNWPKLFEINIK